MLTLSQKLHKPSFLITLSNFIENIVLDKNNLKQNRWLKRYVIKDAFLFSHTVKRNATD